MIEELESLIITSAIQGEGKTNTVANLAYTIALTGKSVLMVDADLRKPALSTRFRAAKDKGLSILKALKRAMPAIQVNRRNNLSENDLLKSRKAMFRNPSLPVLLFIGRLTAQKKLLLLVEAFMRLIDNNFPVNLLFVGGGRWRDLCFTSDAICVINFVAPGKKILTGMDQ